MSMKFIDANRRLNQYRTDNRKWLKEYQREKELLDAMPEFTPQEAKLKAQCEYDTLMRYPDLPNYHTICAEWQKAYEEDRGKLTKPRKGKGALAAQLLDYDHQDKVTGELDNPWIREGAPASGKREQPQEFLQINPLELPEDSPLRRYFEDEERKKSRI